MKKILVLMLGSLLLLTGCPSTDDEISNDIHYSVEKEEIAKNWLLGMFNGSFEDIESQMSKQVKKTVQPGMLAELFTQLLTLDKFERIESSQSSKNGKYINTQVIAVLTSKKLVFNTAFDKKNRLVGINFAFLPLPPPYPMRTDTFREEAITIGEMNLNGMLSMPENVEKPPIAILIQGSGSHGMDYAIGYAGNKPLRDIAHGLAQRGIASIRFDKRYYAHSQLAMSDVTIFNEYILDVNSAIEFAYFDKGLDDIYLIGHSLGAMISPYIAENNPKVKGFISLAGSPRGLEDIMLDQNILALETMDLTEEQAAEALTSIKSEIQKIKELEKGKEGKTLLAMGTPYWYSLNQTTGEELTTNFSCPALILQGDKDFQVSVEKDFEYWISLLSGKENVDFILYNDLNHLFMLSEGNMDIQEYNIASKVNEQVLSDIANWILYN